MESDTRAYFTAVTMMISLPTGTKIFNWLCTYLNNAPLLYIRTSHALFALIFLLMFTIGGSTGVILGNAIVDIPLHDTYYVVAHFHFVLSLGAVIAIFSGIMYFANNFQDNYLPTSTSYISRYLILWWFVLPDRRPSLRHGGLYPFPFVWYCMPDFLEPPCLSYGPSSKTGLATKGGASRSCRRTVNEEPSSRPARYSRRVVGRP